MTVSSHAPVEIAMRLNTVDFQILTTDWWVAVQTSFAAPGNWYSCVQDLGWKMGVNGYAEGPITDISEPVTVLNMALPRGTYMFYFALDDPDGMPTGPWLDWMP